MMELIRSTFPSVRPAWAAALWARLAGGFAGRGAALLMDQAVSSGTNFLTTILIGRACLPDELGLYSLGFTLAMTLMNIPRALVWTPYTSFSPAMNNDERRLFSGSSLVHQTLLCAVMTAAVCLAGLAAMFLDEHRLGAVLVVLGPAMALMFFREYVRRVCFVRLHYSQALAVDVAVCVLQSGGILLLTASGTLTAVRAYLVIAAASLPVVVAWIAANRDTMRLSRASTVSDFYKNWRFGRWVLAGAVVAGVNAALDPWALSFMHGATATGIWAAARTIILFTNPLVLAYQNYFFPHAAHVYARDGVAVLWSVALRATLMVTGLALAFTLVVAVFGEDLLVLIFGDGYAGYGAVVTALMVAEVSTLASTPVTLGVLAVGRGDVVLKWHLIVLAISSTVGLWLVYHFGPVGVGYSTLVACLPADLWTWFAFRRIVKNG